MKTKILRARKMGAWSWVTLAIGAAFLAAAPTVSADGDCNPPESGTTPDGAQFCGQFAADIIVAAFLQSSTAGPGKSCSGTGIPTGSCSFNCASGDWIKVGAAGPPGGQVSGSCGGVTAACTILLTACGDQDGPTNSGGQGTCFAVLAFTYTCGAGPKT